MAVKDRHESPYSFQEKVWRMVWALTQATLFRCSFHTCHGWRRFLLRTYGATIGDACVIRRTVKVECPWNLTMGEHSCLGDGVIVYCLGKVTIGDRVSISQYTHICAGSHDYTQAEMPLLRPPITICDDVWLGADSFVGPNVTIHEGAILGARGVAIRDLDAQTVYGGNPATIIKKRI